jgi:hypothetical protein
MNAMNKKRGLAGMVAVLFLGLAVLLLSACSDEMEVQQSYPFKVENMPVPTRIVKGETVEIRCELKREGHFSDARYTIRYFQPDGKGTTPRCSMPTRWPTSPAAPSPASWACCPTRGTPCGGSPIPSRAPWSSFPSRIRK